MANVPTTMHINVRNCDFNHASTSELDKHVKLLVQSLQEIARSCLKPQKKRCAPSFAVEVGFEVARALNNDDWTLQDQLMATLAEMWGRVYLFDITQQVGWHMTSLLITYPQTFMERWGQVFTWRWVKL